MLTLFIMGSVVDARTRVPGIACLAGRVAREATDVLRPTVGNWMVNGRDAREGINDMPRDPTIGMRIVMSTLVLMVAFRRAFPALGTRAAILMGVMAENILRGVQPHSADVVLSARIVEGAWQEMQDGLRNDPAGFMATQLRGVQRGQVDPDAVQALTMPELNSFLMYLVGYINFGAASAAPFPASMFNPFA